MAEHATSTWKLTTSVGGQTVRGSADDGRTAETGYGGSAAGSEVVETDSAVVADPAGLSVRRRAAPKLLGTSFVVVVVVLLGGAAGWLGYRAHQAHQGQQRHELFLQVGRQAAVNLTTIDWEHADADVQRILDSATGPFHDDFASRAKPFVEVVAQAKSVSAGTVAEAGMESESADSAQVLVAVTVKTSNAGVAEQDPRNWRMRITVQKVGEDVKVSNVGFVP
jgi:Mce-associated membrane protein